MANQQDHTDPPRHEITSKRRRGFPSETQVRRIDNSPALQRRVRRERLTSLEGTVEWRGVDQA